MSPRVAAPAPLRYQSVTGHPEAGLYVAERPEGMNRVLLAALDSFAELGYRGTATRNITRRANISAGGLYTHYASKQELLETIMLTSHQTLLDSMRVAALIAGGPAERLHNVARSHVEFHARYSISATVCTRELHTLDGPIAVSVRVMREEIEQIVADILVEGTRTGDFTIDDPAVVKRFVLSVGVDVSRWFRLDGPLSPEEIGARYADLILKSVS
jgi:AcrR family transcriptional regulator